jgi:hypothetical protein
MRSPSPADASPRSGERGASGERGTSGALGGSGTCGDRGTVTAEFAAVVPAVLLVVAAALGCLQVAGEQLRLQDATADAARSLSRGDGDAVAAARLAVMAPGARLAVSHRGDLVCVESRAESSGGVGLIFRLELQAFGCALDGGR